MNKKGKGEQVMKYSREQIENLEAGRELSELVSAVVMGVTADMTRCAECGAKTYLTSTGRGWCSDCGEWRYSPHKNYSTDIAAAWKVVEKMLLGVDPGRHNGFILSFMENDEEVACWYAEFPDPWEYAEGETAPLAICRAALLAVMEFDE